MNAALIDSIGWTLLHFVWQGALVGCATALTLTALRNAAPGQRYAVACTGLAACFLWPALELALRLRGDGAAAHIRFADSLVRQGDFAAGEGMPAWLQSHMMWIVAFWAVCAVVLALRMALGLLWIRRAALAPAASAQWQQRVERMGTQFGVTRKVVLRVVDDLSSPLTAGWWRPVILVPASLMSGMPADLLEALLAHEMAHVRRFDYLVNLGQNVIETLLFYHPAVWWISRRIRVEREQIADDLAAQHLGEPRRLARALSELERWQFSSHHLAMAANGGDLLSRVKRLVRPDREALNWKAALPVLGLALAGLSLYAHAATADAPPVDAKVEAQMEKQVIRTAAIADFRSCKKPLWPKSSLRAGHTGTVTLGFQIDETGSVVDSTLINSSGDPLLDEAARVGIEKCHFKPGTEDGKPVASWMRMQYVWLLK